jgi:hypothetical protein
MFKDTAQSIKKAHLDKGIFVKSLIQLGFQDFQIPLSFGLG